MAKVNSLVNLSIFLFSIQIYRKVSPQQDFPLCLCVCVLYVKTTLHCQSELVLTERGKAQLEQEMAAVWADSANFQTKLCVQSVGPTG